MRYQDNPLFSYKKGTKLCFPSSMVGYKGSSMEVPTGLGVLPFPQIFLKFKSEKDRLNHKPFSKGKRNSYLNAGRLLE